MLRLIFLINMFIIFVITGCQSQKEVAELTGDALVEHGAYLVEIAGCNDCHSPKMMTPNGPMPDKDLLLSGHPAESVLPALDPDKVGPGNWVRMSEDLTAFVGPWGMSFAANLTPDNNTGIGLWTEENFVQALRTGKHMGAGRPLLPPMPWFNLMHAKDQDLKAIFYYLKSIKPVNNLVPVAIPPENLGKM